MNVIETEKFLLRKQYPKLNHDFVLHSCTTMSYNCIAFAVRENRRWWCPFKGHPNPYWPKNVPKRLTVAAYIQALGTKKFKICANGDLEEGIEKIALYTKDGEPTHASRQLADGRWTSKLGRGFDIIHAEPASVENDAYGVVAHFLCRKGIPADPTSVTLL